MIYVILFFISFLLTYLVRNYAIKKALLAEVNERSSHTTPTPHGGGIAIAVTWFAGLTYLFLTDKIDNSLYFALMCGIALSIVSFFDDVHELPPKMRLLVQSIVALLGIVLLGGLKSIDFGFFVIENQILTNIIAFFAVIWYINLYNFLDGIDGYAGSEAIFLGITGYILFWGAHFLVLIVSVVGFLVWNWHKAKIFMGDTGSTLLGYNIAIFTIYYADKNPENLWIWIVLFGLFWFDATLTLIRRYKNKEKLSQAHKKHAYQRLVQSGFAHDKVVLLSIMLNILLFLLVYFIHNVFISFFAAVLLLYTAVKLIDKKKHFA